MKLDYYQVLELQQTSDPKIIKDAYLRLAAKWHPENNPDNKAEAERHFFRISEAFQILYCNEKRKRYLQCLLKSNAQELEKNDVKSKESRVKQESTMELDQLTEEFETALRKNFLSEKLESGEALSFPSNLISLRDPYKVHVEAVCNSPSDLSDRAFCEQLVQRHIAKGTRHTKNVDPFGNKIEITTVQSTGGEMTLNVTRNGKEVDMRIKGLTTKLTNVSKAMTVSVGPISQRGGGPSSQHGGPSSHHGGPSSHHGGPSSHHGGPSSHHGGPSSYHGGPSSHHGGPSSYRGGSHKTTSVLTTKSTKTNK